MMLVAVAGEAVFGDNIGGSERGDMRGGVVVGELAAVVGLRIQYILST